MKNKSIDLTSNMMSKVQGIFTEKFTSLFQMQEKLETCRNSILANFRRSSFWDDIKNVVIIL